MDSQTGLHAGAASPADDEQAIDSASFVPTNNEAENVPLLIGKLNKSWWA
ncbi:MAG: hypothetical protein JWM91_1952 [Rhodospirillales bacterium]|nr:hypothetical protein [Rhodospirillales bacterium]